MSLGPVATRFNSQIVCIAIPGVAIATDIWNYGPCRGYWCFGFEGFNKVLKRGAKGTNLINEVEGVMKYWSIFSAREMVTRRRSVSRV